MIVRELLPVPVQQVEYVQDLQHQCEVAQARLAAACQALTCGRVPKDAQVVGGLTHGYLIVSYVAED